MEKHPRGYCHILGDIQVIVPLWSVLVFKQLTGGGDYRNEILGLI